jgi:hypothetical protein
LQDYVIPQKYYSTQFAQAKNAQGKVQTVSVTLRQEGHRRIMDFGTARSVDVTDLLGNYDPLR